LNLHLQLDNPGSPKGPSCFSPAAAGTSANGDQTPAAYYSSLGYESVQIEWANDWEITNAPAADTGNNSSTNYPPTFSRGLPGSDLP